MVYVQNTIIVLQYKSKIEPRYMSKIHSTSRKYHGCVYIYINYFTPKMFVLYVFLLISASCFSRVTYIEIRTKLLPNQSLTPVRMLLQKVVGSKKAHWVLEHSSVFIPSLLIYPLIPYIFLKFLFQSFHRSARTYQFPQFLS